jgi:hypothetical protein
MLFYRVNVSGKTASDRITVDTFKQTIAFKGLPETAYDDLLARRSISNAGIQYELVKADPVESLIDMQNFTRKIGVKPSEIVCITVRRSMPNTVVLDVAALMNLAARRGLNIESEISGEWQNMLIEIDGIEICASRRVITDEKPT